MVGSWFNVCSFLKKRAIGGLALPCLDKTAFPAGLLRPESRFAFAGWHPFAYQQGNLKVGAERECRVTGVNLRKRMPVRSYTNHSCPQCGHFTLDCSSSITGIRDPHIRQRG